MMSTIGFSYLAYLCKQIIKIGHGCSTLIYVKIIVKKFGQRKTNS